MCDLAGFSQRVLRIFSLWSGYPRLSRMMAEFPDVDVYLAGGAIRNLLLNPESRVKDFDIFLAGQRLRQAVDWLSQEGRTTRGVFGNVHWYPEANEPLRADLIPVSNFSRIYPSKNMEDALDQFDFTGNAIAINLRAGALLDPHHGVRDLQQRIMRAVRFDFGESPISPGHTLHYVACLWFRILHYAAALGLQIEPATMRWLLEHRDYRQLRGDYAREFKEPHPGALAVLDASPDAYAAW